LATNSQSFFRVTVRGTMWGYISRYSAKILVFISTTILARILSKEDFGVAGYAIVAINFIEFLQGLGLRQALIYYPKNERQNYTAFWLGIGSGVLLFFASLFIISPLTGIFYNDPRAVPVTQVLSFYFILVSLNIVQEATLSKKLAFGQRSIPSISNSLSKGLISIFLALLGFGAWSLIYGQLVGTAVEVVAYWRITKWRPAFQFEKKFVRPLMSYGLNIFSISAMSNLLSNVDYLLVGRFMGAEVLGIYTLAFRLPELLIKQFSGIIGDVIFPVFTKMKDDPNALKRGFLTTLEYVNLITVPMGLGLAVVAELVILVFFGEKWLDAVPVMVAISIFSMIRAMVFNTGDTYKAMGRPEILTKINFRQTVVTVPVLWWAASQIRTAFAVALVQVVIIFFFGVIKLIIAVNILEIKPSKIVKALSPSLLAGGLMALVVLGVVKQAEKLPPTILLALAVGVGGIVYFGVLLIFHRPRMIQFGTRLFSAINRKGN